MSEVVIGKGMTAARGGILWRIARLHPAWVTLTVWVGYFFAGVAQWLAESTLPLAAAAAFSGFMLLYMGYPLFALLYLPGRFRSRSSPRFGRALAAFFALWVVVSAARAAGEENMNALVGAANSGNVAAILAFMVPFLTIFAAMLYLLIGAALALVEAETGGITTFRRKFGTALAFLCLMIGVFFIHRRIRRLVAQEGKPDPIVDVMPRERLVLEPMKSGHLCLELTERVGWEDFARYGEELLRRLDGRVTAKGSVSDMHLWNVEIETLPLHLVYEDFPNHVCLESDSHAGDMLLRKLQERLAPGLAY